MGTEPAETEPHTREGSHRAPRKVTLVSTGRYLRPCWDMVLLCDHQSCLHNSKTWAARERDCWSITTWIFFVNGPGVLRHPPAAGGGQWGRWGSPVSVFSRTTLEQN